jgi:DNA-binding transcriptional LysR family regulator
MELRHVRHFVAVAEELNFRKAAQRLNMAQPPLSQSIRRLEDSLGVQLLDRSRRGVALTSAGRAFLDEARNTIRHADLGRKLAQREAEDTQEIRISFITAATYQLVPRLLADFHAKWPALVVRLHEAPSPTQVAALLAGDNDVGFVSADTKGLLDLDSRLVERARIVAAVPADWPIASRDSISLAELAEHYVILPPKIDFALGSDAVVSLFRKAGVMPYVAQSETHATTTLALVGAGLGCTLATTTSAIAAPRYVRFIAISDQIASSDWGLKMVWRPQLAREPAKRFVQFVIDAVAATPSLLTP